MKILIVDDFASMRRIVKNLLRDIGHKDTTEADNGTTALLLLAKSNYDLVIVDSNMPKMNGIALLKAIRQDEKLCNLPVLLVTPDAKRKLIVEAAAAGVNGFIVKPFTNEILADKLTKIFARLERKQG